MLRLLKYACPSLLLLIGYNTYEKISSIIFINLKICMKIYETTNHDGVDSRVWYDVQYSY